MTTSIAMTTYNGKDYIVQLLDSLREQNKKVDEVIIVDDCSTDNTVSIVEDYIKTYDLPNWNIYINDTNIGWKKNFREALKKCQGDFIFLCDQDDIWEKDKIELMTQTMSDYPEILLLVSNYSVLNVDRKDKVKVKGLEKNDGSIEKMKFSETALTVMRPGCTYCVRRQLIELMLCNDIDTEPHDQILWGYAVINDGLYLLNRKTIKFRRHSDSASISKNISREERRRNTTYLELFEKVASANGMRDKATIIRNQIRFVKEREKVIESKSLTNLISFHVHNRKHYTTLRNMLSDYLLFLTVDIGGI